MAARILYIRTHEGWLYLAVVVDLFSRRVVGWSMGSRIDTSLVLDALVMALWRRQPKDAVTVHSDQGRQFTGHEWQTFLRDHNLVSSMSRCGICHDNAFAESLFRMAKYRPEFAVEGFVDLNEARNWATSFVRLCNVDHRHSGIRCVSPAQRHAGEDHAILATRHALYAQARERNPARWSGQTRNWQPIGVVTLNPEHDAVVAMALRAKEIQLLAA